MDDANDNMQIPDDDDVALPQEEMGYLVDSGPCPYDHDEHFTAFYLAFVPSTPIYRRLMDLRFRRSGSGVYLPACNECQACTPIRIPAARFQPSKSQRRCRNRNADLQISWHERGLDDERLDLFKRYQATVHDDPIGDDQDPQAFLVEDGGIIGGELHARDGSGQLLAVSVVDFFQDALSSVYCYYDPDQTKRSLGTYMAMAEIDWCVARKLDWLYLGFYVGGCPKMTYKAQFRPCQILEHSRWIEYGHGAQL